MKQILHLTEKDAADLDALGDPQLVVFLEWLADRGYEVRKERDLDPTRGHD